MSEKRPIKIYARNKRTRELTEVTDLYWFEEQGIHWFDGESHLDLYDIELFIDGEKKWP